MKRNETMKWCDIYKVWQTELRKYPQLQGKPHYRSVAFSQPPHGPCFHFNWAPKGSEEQVIQADLKRLASWLDVGEDWSKGTVRTAGLLAGCETEEEFAAVWIAGFTRSLYCWKTTVTTTVRNACLLESEARSVIGQKIGYWHNSSRDFFPETYLPNDLFWDCEAISPSTLIRLAALNAAMVATHYTPVEYKMAHP